jgi:hypothetical protein
MTRDVGYEIKATNCIPHLKSHVYEAEQLRTGAPFQKGEIARSCSIMGGITSRI